MGNGKSAPKGEKDVKRGRNGTNGSNSSRLFARKTCNQRDISGQLPTARNGRQDDTLPAASSPRSYDIYPRDKHRPRSIRTDDKDMYQCALEQVLDNWPEYEALRNVVLPSSEPATVDTLHQMYSRMLDQHRHVKYLLVENRELRQSLGEIEEELSAQIQMMKRRDVEMLRLKSTLERHPPNDSPPDSDHPLRRTRSTFRPTPLVQAEGPDGMAVVVRRHSSSLTPSPAAAHGDGPARHNSLSANFGRTCDLAETITRLQTALEAERAERQVLAQRLCYAGTVEDLPVPADTERSLVERYSQLGAIARDQIYSTLERHLGHVPTARKFAFLAATMETSYHVTSEALDEFRDGLHSLLLHPLHPPRYPEAVVDTDGSRIPRHVLDRVRTFECYKDSPTKPTLRALASGDIPDCLMSHVNAFLRDMSDVINLTPLTERLVDALRKDFRECCTPALLNSTGYQHFMQDTCQLAWRMNVVQPPLYVTTDNCQRFDDRYHVLSHDESTPITATDIEYTMWPVLFQKKHGVVLCKGRVCLLAC